MNLQFRCVDEMTWSHHSTCCRLQLPPQPRDGEFAFIR